MNYLLFVGLALFSSACGALLVTLLRMTRRDPLRAPSQPGPTRAREREQYMTEPADAGAAATALVVSKDALACQLIIDALRPLAIRPEICEEVFAAARLLDKQKFEAVVVDLCWGRARCW